MWREAPGKTMESPVIKVTWVKRHSHWRVLWQRADFKCHRDDPLREATTLKAVLEEVVADPFGCFLGEPRAWSTE